MKWNWQQTNWPNFRYQTNLIEALEKKFIYKSGLFIGAFRFIDSSQQDELKIELISQEALQTSKIEGEILDRLSLQSSIRKNFGMEVKHNRSSLAEKGIAEMMIDLYQNYNKPLTQANLFRWNSLLLYGQKNLIKSYRDSEEPMQVVSNSISKPKIHFEAPPSSQIYEEMSGFIDWFNKSSNSIPALIRAAIAHLYFVSIHPFEDGNGRIARALAEKSLSQDLGHASLISLSHIIEKNKKKYYQALDISNKNLEVDYWIKYFAETVLEAQDYSQEKLEFLIRKSKFFEEKIANLNLRQEKVIQRIFAEDMAEFKGGLSTENYISITKCSRATATRDLDDLLEKGILYKTGKLKSTRYYLVI